MLPCLSRDAKSPTKMAMPTEPHCLRLQTAPCHQPAQLISPWVCSSWMATKLVVLALILSLWVKQSLVFSNLAKQGNRPSRRDQEGIRGSEQAVHRTLVFPSSETRVSGNFCANIKVANYRLLYWELQLQLFGWHMHMR